MARRHHRRQVRDRPAGREHALRRLRGEVEQAAEPPRDVLLELHDRGARLPQPDVPVQPLREELRERRGVEPAARDVGEVAGAAVLEGVARRLERLRRAARPKSPVPTSGGAAARRRATSSAPSVASAGASARPPIQADQRLGRRRPPSPASRSGAGSSGKPPPTGSGSTLTPALARSASSSSLEESATSVDRAIERLAVPRGGLAEPAHLAHVLQRGLTDLVVGHDLGARAQSFDASAHAAHPTAGPIRGGGRARARASRRRARAPRPHRPGRSVGPREPRPRTAVDARRLGVRGQRRRRTGVGADLGEHLVGRARRIGRMPRGRQARRAARRTRHRTRRAAAAASPGRRRRRSHTTIPPAASTAAPTGIAAASGAEHRVTRWAAAPTAVRTPTGTAAPTCAGDPRHEPGADRRAPPARHGGHAEGRVVGHPADARVEHLDPRVRVGVPHVVVAGERVALPRPVPRDDPRRDALGPQQHRHRRRDVLAEPAPGVEQEVIHRVDARRLPRHGEVVPRVRLEPGLHGHHGVVLVVRARRDLVGEVAVALGQLVGQLQDTARRTRARATGASGGSCASSPASGISGPRTPPSRRAPGPGRSAPGSTGPRVVRSAPLGKYTVCGCAAREQHVRLRLLDEERLHERLRRPVEPVGARHVVAAAVVAHERDQVLARLRPQAPVVGVEHLRAPQLRERRANAEHDVVRQLAARTQVHHVAEPRIAVRREVDDLPVGRWPAATPGSARDRPARGCAPGDIRNGMRPHHRQREARQEREHADGEHERGGGDRDDRSRRRDAARGRSRRARASRAAGRRRAAGTTSTATRRTRRPTPATTTGTTSTARGRRRPRSSWCSTPSRTRGRGAAARRRRAAPAPTGTAPRAARARRRARSRSRSARGTGPWRRATRARARP